MTRLDHRFYDDDDGELIHDIKLGTYEVVSTTVTVHATSRHGFSEPRQIDHMTINYVIRRDK